MILGIGTDIIEMARIQAILMGKFRGKFIKRVLVESEIKIFNSKANQVSYFAKRFAAKEAISKAFACGIGGRISFQDIEISSLVSGKPTAKIIKSAIKTPVFTGNPELLNIHISLSDTDNYALAYCILEAKIHQEIS